MVNTDVVIEEIKPEDVARVAGQLRRRPDSVLESWEKDNRSGDMTMLVAKIDGEVVGTVNVVWKGMANENLARETGRAPMIQALEVKNEYRRKGIASLLMDRAESLAAQRSNNIVLAVETGNTIAREMYEKRGYKYKTVSGKDTYTDLWPRVGDDGKKFMYDAVCMLMVKQLGS